MFIKDDRNRLFLCYNKIGDNMNDNSNNNNNNNEYNNQSYGDYVNSLYNGPEEKSKANITILVISIVNAVFVAPVVLEFAVIWLIFGALGGSSATYYGLLLICAAYLIFSAIFLLRSIWKCINSKTGKIIFAVVLLLLIGRFIIMYNNIKKENDDRRINNTTQIENPREQETEDVFKKIPTEKFMIDNDKVVNKIYTLGYNKTTDNCSSSNDCYTNGKYHISNMKNIKEFNVQRKMDSSKMDKYDCTDDLTLLSTLYDNQDILSFKDMFNSVIKKMKYNFFYDYVTIAKGMRIRIYITYDNKIGYEISPSETQTIFNPNSIRTIVLKGKNNENMEVKEFLYDVAIENNKNNFKMNDYIYSHYKNDGNSFRKLSIQEGHYKLDVDNSGSVGYNFNYYEYFDATELSIQVEGNYFDKSYKSFIENDLIYFNEKLNKKYEYSENLDNSIKSFIENKDKDLKVEVDDTLTIIIRRADFATSLRYFTVEYKFK